MDNLIIDNNLTVRKQLSLSLPMAFEQLVNIFMTLIDTLVVGLLGTYEVACVGAMATILNILFILPNTIMTSNNVIIANYLGSKEKIKIKYTLGNSIIFGLVVGFLFSLIVIFISPVIPKMFNLKQSCIVYLFIRLIGYLPLIINDILSGFERTKGNPKFILKCKIIFLGLNFILDLLMIKLNYGIVGVALVTVFLDITFMIVLLLRNKTNIIFKYKKDIFSNIIYYIKWNVVEKIIYKIDILIMNIVVSNLSIIQYSVHVILSQLLDMYRDFISGIQNGISVNVGIIQGAKKYSLYNKLQDVSKKIQNVLLLLAPLCLIIISFIISKIYFKDIIQLSTFYIILPIIIINSIINIVAIYYYAYLRGVKDFKFLANRNIISSILKIIIAIILSKYFGIIGVWISYFLYSISQFLISKRRFNIIKY